MMLVYQYGEVNPLHTASLWPIEFSELHPRLVIFLKTSVFTVKHEKNFNSKSNTWRFSNTSHSLVISTWPFWLQNKSTESTISPPKQTESRARNKTLEPLVTSKFYMLVVFSNAEWVSTLLVQTKIKQNSSFRY